MAMRCAVFLDKDGTLVEDVPYNVEPGEMRLAPGVIEGLQALQAAGYRLIVVSNQSGVARGYFAPEALADVWARLRGLTSEHGIELDAWYYCPHHPEGVVAKFATVCGCRKPAPGLLLEAAADHGIDLGRSWMVGDILNDVEAGHWAGCRSVLIDNGNETEWLGGPGRTPDFTVRDLAEAASVIIGTDQAEWMRDEGVAEAV
jgi:D-glycero-D-manno-heptose 1,7-bisphosphate phosphatase